MNKGLVIIAAMAILGMTRLNAQAAVLNANDVLTIDAGSWFALDFDNNQSISGSEMLAISPGTDGGVRIGSIQGAGMIDAWSMWGQPGYHYTSVAPIGGTTSGIDFSGWSVFYNGSPVVAAFDYGAWTPINCATLGCTGVNFVADVAAFSWSGVYGENYGLWYSWRFLDAAPGAFDPTDYLLHLVGTVQAAPEVPVPPAAWLFCSGLLGLIFSVISRRTI